jgi:4-amino-4-deoxy-L-arabinose transferase-like glycosyltransferase
MVAGARTFSLEDTFLAPQILNRPPTRHALLAFLVALAAVLHIGTAGWGALYDGGEGQLAGGAREMLRSHQWLVPTNNGVPVLETPPLPYWALALSYKIFGVTAVAARVPIALAMIGSVALTFLIGERLGNYWRGFAAGLVHLCSAGAFLLGRLVTPDSLLTLFISGAIYCAVCGYQNRKFRRIWFGLFWLSTSLACLTKDWETLLYVAAPCLLLAIFFREARLRFRSLLHWANLILFAALVVPWFLWAHSHYPGFPQHSFGGTSPWRFLSLHFAWWFPGFFLVLPALLFAPRKIFRPNEMTFADALPLCWVAVVVFATFLIGDRHVSASILTIPGFALTAAWAWERSPRHFQIAGLVLALLMGLLFAGFVNLTPDAFGVSWKRMGQITAVVLVLFSIPALILAAKRRVELAVFAFLAAMVPIGFCLVESAARTTPFFSLADAAQFLNPRLGGNGQVLYEGRLQDANSLAFYLDKNFFLVNQPPAFLERDAVSRSKYLDERFVLEAWDRSSPIYLIIDESRVSHWRKLISDRVHIYHQVSTCGSRVILSNQL